MIIRFELTVEIDDISKSGEDGLTEEQSEGLGKILSNMEEIVGKEDLTLDDSSWEEV